MGYMNYDEPFVHALGYADSFWFGKHKGRTVRQVVDEDPRYIGWCVQRLNVVGFAQEVIDEVLPKLPVGSRQTVEALNKRKIAKNAEQGGDFVAYMDAREEERIREREAEQEYEEMYRKRYDEYGGIHDLDDDYINDVLDGCPEAYWNID
jgi:hypothetical protein